MKHGKMQHLGNARILTLDPRTGHGSVNNYQVLAPKAETEEFRSRVRAVIAHALGQSEAALRREVANLLMNMPPEKVAAILKKIAEEIEHGRPER